MGEAGSLAELRLEIEALRASRARVVAEADAQRRQIERELHDGTQQHLVALAVNLELARQLVDTDPGALPALLDELGSDVRQALESVRTLAQRVYPPLLLDRGLVDALRGAVADLGVAARVEARDVGRHQPELESTVYFCCLEALRNVADHAGGARAQVCVWQEDQALCWSVADNGPGFDSSTSGAGIDRMRDLVDALGGRLSVSSEPAGGCSVSGTIPLAR